MSCAWKIPDHSAKGSNDFLAEGQCALILMALVALVPLASANEVEGTMDRFCLNIPNGQFVANPRSCQHWIFCQNGRATEGQCQGIFYFDPVLQMCRYPVTVDCPFDNVDVNCKSNNLELHPHPNSCKQYVACVEGFPRVINCAPSLHWNPVTQQCDFPHAANCQIIVSVCVRIIFNEVILIALYFSPRSITSAIPPGPTWFATQLIVKRSWCVTRASTRSTVAPRDFSSTHTTCSAILP